MARRSSSSSGSTDRPSRDKRRRAEDSVSQAEFLQAFQSISASLSALSATRQTAGGASRPDTASHPPRPSVMGHGWLGVARRELPLTVRRAPDSPPAWASTHHRPLRPWVGLLGWAETPRGSRPVARSPGSTRASRSAVCAQGSTSQAFPEEYSRHRCGVHPNAGSDGQPAPAAIGHWPRVAGGGSEGAPAHG